MSTETEVESFKTFRKKFNPRLTRNELSAVLSVLLCVINMKKGAQTLIVGGWAVTLQIVLSLITYSIIILDVLSLINICIKYYCHFVIICLHYPVCTVLFIDCIQTLTCQVKIFEKQHIAIFKVFRGKENMTFYIPDKRDGMWIK